MEDLRLTKLRNRKETYSPFLTNSRPKGANENEKLMKWAELIRKEEEKEGISRVSHSLSLTQGRRRKKELDLSLPLWLALKHEKIKEGKEKKGKNKGRGVAYKLKMIKCI